MIRLKRTFFSRLLDYIKHTDILLFAMCLCASAYGCVLVYSATLSDLTPGRRLTGSVLTMLIALALGIIACLIVSSIDYEIIAKLWPFIAAVCIGLMIITRFFGVALTADRPDARSWLKIAGFYFQSSEILKVGFIITFSVHLNKIKENINSIFNVALLTLHAAAAVMLVMLVGDAGSALVFVIIFIAMMFAAGLHALYFAVGGAAIAVGFPLAWILNLIKPFQQKRFLALLYPQEYAQSEAYQQNRAITAMGSGKIFGKGLFKGPYTQSGYVPESRNDMILSVAGEELGFVGCLALVLLLFFIVLRMIRCALKARNPIGYFMCCGMAGMIAGQAALNIGMCVRLVPVIGITLPFFSAGGSSNLSLYFGIGLVMSVFRFSTRTDGDYKRRSPLIYKR